MSDKKVYIANGQGFWGDSLLGPLRLVEEGPLDYLTFDYLAEVTMSIMQKQRLRKPEAGYATDFVRMLERILPTCHEKGIKIIANAGGVNPQGCASAVREVIEKLGLKGLKVGVVEGDDILADLPGMVEGGEKFKNLDTDAPISDIMDRVSSANVYIGAQPIAEALDQGADIVITGRATDPSVVVGALIHEFGWSMEDYDRLAAGTVMGHILECGPQCTGGNYSRWREIDDFVRIGYPIAVAEASGDFTITKHDGTGGLVDIETVTSQLLYEMGDPQNYLGPDCIADFTSMTLSDDGKDRVRVSGVKGRPPTDTYKVSIAFENGYKILSQLTVCGPDAIAKAKLTADIIFGRAELHGVKIPEENRFVELLGTHVCYQGIVPPPEGPGEVVLRIGAKSTDRKALETLGGEIVPVLTSGPPGLTGFAGGRARASEIVGYWPALIDKKLVKTSVSVESI